jgi:hypothetical protein
VNVSGIKHQQLIELKNPHSYLGSRIVCYVNDKFVFINFLLVVLALGSNGVRLIIIIIINGRLFRRVNRNG